MAQIHGKSGCTKYLLKRLKPIDGKNLTNFEEIQHFHDNFPEILAETIIHTEKQQNELISLLNDEDARLDGLLKEGIAKRTEEVYGRIADLDNKVKTSETFFRKLSYRIQYQIHFHSRNYRIRSPFRQIERELRDVRNRKVRLIAGKPHVIEKERKRVADVHAYLREEGTSLTGAEGEEQVISFLSQLPDEYHVFNDINLHFGTGFHWKAYDEWIQTSQIDHVVMGPTGVYLLETKNWRPSDLINMSEKLIRQVRRCNVALWYYLKDFYLENKCPKIRNAIVSIQGSQPGWRLDYYIDVIRPYQLSQYILHRKPTLSKEEITKLVRIMTS